MEDQNITSRTTNIISTTTTSAVSNSPIIDRIAINGDLYRSIVGANGWNGYECSNDQGITFTRQYTYNMLEERIKALEERIEQIEEALMIESAKNLDSLIENDSGGEE